METLRPFQRRFLSAALRSGVDTAALSMARGNGKSWLAAHILARCLTPGDRLYVPGAEYLLCSGSIEQSRLCFRFVRQELEPRGGYRFLDASTRVGITHPATNTRLRVLSSNGKTAFGIVGTPLLVADEPGSWEVVGGQLMHDAIQTAMGKPGSPLKAVYIGTKAPAVAGWWHDLVDGGSHGTTHVTKLEGDRETWDRWPTIQKANPLVGIAPEFRRKLLEERDAARGDTRLKARFLSFRLNLPTADEDAVLLTVDDFKGLAARATPERHGRPIVGLDLGGGRAWSAAVALWENGRIEALAVAPGIPGLAEQERRDRVPGGTYQRLHDVGRLRTAEGLRVQPPAQLWAAIVEEWGAPARVVCDRFREAELRDAARSARIEPRVSRWSESSADIRALRRGTKDGPLAVAATARDLLAASLSVAVVKHDDAGNVRLTKRTANTARDDVAAALVLAAGAWERERRKPGKARYLGAV